MRGAIPPFPNTPSWRDAQLKKHRYNFTLFYQSDEIPTLHEVQIKIINFS